MLKNTRQMKYYGVALLTSLSIVAAVRARPVQGRDNPLRWEHAMQRFEQKDRTNPPPQHAVLFIGSSAIRKWHTLARDFPGIPVINRGFGGSEIHDATYYANQIIVPYHPRDIVLFAGANDLAAGMTPEQVVADYKQFVETVHAKLPNTPIIYISIDPSPTRWKNQANIMETNSRIAAIANDTKKLVFVDILTPMLNANGNPREDLFLKDRLHPNDKGYRIWASLIRPYLESPSPDK